MFGDIAADITLDTARAAHAQAVISTSPDPRVATGLLSADLDADLIVRAESATEASKYYDAGAMYVIVPDAFGRSPSVTCFRRTLVGFQLVTQPDTTPGTREHRHYKSESTREISSSSALCNVFEVEQSEIVAVGHGLVN